MGCNDLILAIGDLVEALGTGAAGCPAPNVYCGSSGGSATGGVQLLPPVLGPGGIETLVPFEDVEEGPGTGDPPGGFDTWEEFRTYKCQAANWLVDTLINSLRNLAVANLAVSTANLLGVVVLSALGLVASAIALPMALALIGICAQLELLAAGANSLLNQVADYMAERRAEIVCSMYFSGSASEAVTLLNSILEDAVEGLVIGGVFESAAGPIGEVIGGLLAGIVDIGLTRIMWQVSADVIYPNADCSECVEAQCDREHHFTDGIVGWEVSVSMGEVGSESVSWLEAPDPVDSNDTGSPGCMQFVCTKDTQPNDVGCSIDYILSEECRFAAVLADTIHLDTKIDRDSQTTLYASWIFSDNTSESGVVTKTTAWFVEGTAPISAPNVGKTVKGIRFSHQPAYAATGSWTWLIDRVWF